jgi:hypothetical protein
MSTRQMRSFAIIFICYFVTVLSCFDRNNLLEITNELSRLALPRIASVTSGDSTHLIITFTKEMDQVLLADIVNYSITSLTVSNAIPAADGLSVELTTNAQATVQYTLIVSNLTSAEGYLLYGSTMSFAGDGIPEVLLVQASSKNRIEIQFSENIDPSTAIMANFSLTLSSVPVAILGVTPSGISIFIDTVTMTNELYSLAISNIKDATGNAMVPVSIDFEGTSSSSYLAGSGTPYMDVTISSNLFYILLKDDSDGVYIKRSDMKGEAFMDIIPGPRVTASMTQLPVLQVTGSIGDENIYFSAFNSADNTVKVYRSRDAGANWAIVFSRDLSDGNSTGIVRPVIRVVPGVTEANDRIYLAFYNDGSLTDVTWNSMILAKSLDGGDTWQYSSAPLTNPAPATYVIRDIDVDVISNVDPALDRIFISCHDSNSKSLIFSRSFDGGLTWSFQTIDPGNSSDINLGQYSNVIVKRGVADNGTDDIVIVAYYDASTNIAGRQDLKISKSINGGSNFNMSILDNVSTSSDSTNTGLKIDMGFSDDRVYIVYQNLNAAGTDEIKLIRSKSFGATWETNQTLISVEDRQGHLIVLGKYVHVFFESGSSITQMRSVTFGEIWP